MRAQFLLVPAALIASAPALAQESHRYLTFAQVQKSMFPGAKLVPYEFRPKDAQYETLKRSAGVLWSYYVKIWKVSTGGWLFIDQVLGKDDTIIYAVGLNPDGSVIAVEILQCVARYDSVRNPKWLGQFTGRRYSPGDTMRDVTTISGSTLSSINITDGVRRVVAAHALFFAQAETPH